MDRTGWRLGDPHPHMPTHSGQVIIIGFFFLFFSVYGHRHTPSPSSNLEELGLSTRRAMTRLIRMGVPLKRQAYLTF